MPELPDIVILAESMNHALTGKQVFNTMIYQPKVSRQQLLKSLPFKSSNNNASLSVFERAKVMREPLQA